MKQSYRILASLSSSKCGLRRKNKEGENRMAYTILRFKKDKGGAIAGCDRHLYVSELIARNSKTFCVPKNRRNLTYNQVPLLIIS